METSALSIEKLIRMAFEQRLITDFRMTPGATRLYRNDEVVVECDHEEARYFLRGLLFGAGCGPFRRGVPS